MEKFSAYRDPGTGIQPFLTPVPPIGPDLLAKVTLPLRYILGLVRTIIILLLLPIYIILVPGLCLVFTPAPPIRRAVSHLFTAIVTRLALLVLGFFWISCEQVTRKRGRGQNKHATWQPRAGDVIVSNWVSWIELLWLAFRFDPIFVLPIPEVSPSTIISSRPSTPISHTPGRRTGTGSANIQSLNKPASVRVPIIGFRQVSLLSIISLTGTVPHCDVSTPTTPFRSLEDIRSKSDRPLVIFPECTTSNGRGLLRFSKVFHQTLPVKSYQVFVMCVRSDPPTILAPTLSQPIPSNLLNPLVHIFTLASSITLPTISIRLLESSESPSSPLFIASEVITGSSSEDQLTEACAALIASIGKMKRTGMGWEDKASFLEFYRGRQK